MFNFTPEEILAKVLIVFVAIPIHEWAHVWAAYQLGDDTGRLMGRLTLNPLAHIDPIGALSIFIAGFGWGKPAPVNPYRLRGDRRTSWMLTALAGPASNFLMAMLAAIPFRLGLGPALMGAPGGAFIVNILISFLYINLLLMVFNLIPIPPLDGSRVLARILPAGLAASLEQLERYAGIGLLMVIFLLSRLGVFSLIISPAIQFLVDLLIFT